MTVGRGGRVLSALGLSVSLLGVYVLTNAGRIDIIDGQIRYEVAANWLTTGEPTLRDRALTGTVFATRTVTVRPPNDARALGLRLNDLQWP